MKSSALERFRLELLSTGEYKTSQEFAPKHRSRPGVLTTMRLAWNVGKLFPMTAIYSRLGCLANPLWEETCFSAITCAETLGIRVMFEGWRNRSDYRGPVVYVCNHMSMFETIMLPPVLLTFGSYVVVVKESLAHMPFLGKRETDFMGLLPISRSNPREDLLKVLDVGVEKIKSGVSLWVFPQGSRMKTFDYAYFSSIGAKVAERAQCPICPLVIDTRCMPVRDTGILRNVFRDFGSVDTSYDVKCKCGPLVPVAKSKVMHNQVFDWMAQQLSDWGLPVKLREKPDLKGAA